jgi:hypothetical protein
VTIENGIVYVIVQHNSTAAAVGGGGNGGAGAELIMNGGLLEIANASHESHFGNGRIGGGNGSNNHGTIVYTNGNISILNENDIRSGVTDVSGNPLVRVQVPLDEWDYNPFDLFEHDVIINGELFEGVNAFINSDGNLFIFMPDPLAPPALTPGAANRTGDSNATVTFNSNKPGEIFYIVRDANDSTPPPTKQEIKDNGVPGGMGIAGQNTLNLTGLNAGAQQILIVKEDENGISEVLSITIPAYTLAPPPNGDANDMGNGIWIQTGANSNQGMMIFIESMRLADLGITNSHISTWQGAQAAITELDNALNIVVTARAGLGAYQNMLEFTIANLDISSENLSASESQIRNADMAKEMMKLIKANILQQVAILMLSQANNAPQVVLQLLQ